MLIDEVFPNPTVKQVIFQIRYPNLFFLESKMGDIQIEIMEDFPESELVLQRQIILAHVGPGSQIDAALKEQSTEIAKKIWKFSSTTGVELTIAQDSLALTSTAHKTYNNPEGQPRFREAIEAVLGPFFKITGLPMVLRIGLRYIDECPIPEKETVAFQAWYDSCFPLARFPLEDASEMHFRTNVKRGDYSIRYQEMLEEKDGQAKLILDFDGYAQDVESSRYLDTTDLLHTIVVEEFTKTIRVPVYEYMRGTGGS